MNRLRKLRESRSLTQIGLAEKANVSRSVIARFETGRSGLSVKSLKRIAEVIGCSWEDILRDDQTEKGA